VKKRPINVEAVVARIAPKLSSDLRALAAAIRTLDVTELRQWGDLVESNLQKAAVLGGKVSANVRQANALTLTSSSSPAAQRLSGDLLSKETYYSVKRDLLQCQKRPTTVSKETYYSVKRDLLHCQKRPTTVSKETYYSVKRDLLHCQKRPTTLSKETYYTVKRDLLQCQKRPTTVSKETYY
jgi:hypothetical protein